MAPDPVLCNHAAVSKRLHKTDQAKRPRAAQLRMGRGAVEQAFSSGSVTYQLERVKCGKKKCKRCGRGPAHGPYWYAYWKAKGRTRTKYVGKVLPRALVDVDQGDDGH